MTEILKNPPLNLLIEKQLQAIGDPTATPETIKKAEEEYQEWLKRHPNVAIAVKSAK